MLGQVSFMSIVFTSSIAHRTTLSRLYQKSRSAEAKANSGKLEIVTKSVLNLPNLFMLIKQGSQSRPRNFMEWKMNEFFLNLSEGFPGGGISQMFFWGILNRKITHLHGHSLGILYSGSTSSFPELLQKDHSPFAIETSNVWVLNYAKWKKISPWDNELHFFI